METIKNFDITEVSKEIKKRLNQLATVDYIIILEIENGRPIF